ncbi:hypothetical protein BT63DRAFT_428769 [Microthyrium microscopicum]|uniref:AB hydrolase-1 domain-containing protein n=1 Tax=Microthyrium microscopicum TaxID=703497 RepID=A0A6A6U1N5_9PEZI|nr:hypothetical protein BT63DRAFT_428769 [Microthyrium microscopicum]
MKPRWLQRFSRSASRANTEIPASTNSVSTPSTSISAPPTSISTPATLPTETFYPSGIKLLYGAENAIIDILFIHGLTGDREKSWTTQGSVATLWPQSLLPARIPNARVLTFGYDAHVADWRGMVSKNRIGNHAMNLLTTLATYREDDDSDQRPIIFVCHSLGGLVCEDALLLARQRPEQHLQRILECTRGIVFFGTPHHGSGLANWADKLAVAIGLLKQTNPEILAVLKSDSEVLARIQEGFHAMMRQLNQTGRIPIDITCFYEELPLPGIGVVVPSHSAVLPGYTPIGIRRNHMDMIRFGSMDDPGFTAVAGELRRWVKRLDLSTTARQPEPPLIEVPMNNSAERTDSPPHQTLPGSVPSTSSTPAVPPTPDPTFRGGQSPIAAGGDVKIGNSEQNLSGNFYGSVQISQYAKPLKIITSKYGPE